MNKLIEIIPLSLCTHKIYITKWSAIDALSVAGVWFSDFCTVRSRVFSVQMKWKAENLDAQQTRAMNIQLLEK